MAQTLLQLPLKELLLKVWVVLLDAPTNIEFNFTSVDSAGDTTGNATATWKVGNTKVATSTVIQGKNSFNITPHLKIGANTIRMTVTDSFGTTLRNMDCYGR